MGTARPPAPQRLADSSFSPVEACDSPAPSYTRVARPPSAGVPGLNAQEFLIGLGLAEGRFTLDRMLKSGIVARPRVRARAEKT